jgi:cytochrome P450
MTTAEVNLLDADTAACPYAAYRALRDEAPVWFDPAINMYILTRADDVRAAFLDKRFSAEVALAGAGQEEQERALFEQRGWVAGPSLTARDEPEHMAVRSLYEPAFKPAAIASMEPMIERHARRLIEDVVSAGCCDWVSTFAVPLPLHVTGEWLQIPEEDLPRARQWSDAFVSRTGVAQTPAERLASAEAELEAQHYFHDIFERVRRQPDKTMFSVLVNTEIPGLGRCLNENERQAEALIDLLVGGLESTANTLAEGARLLIEQPDLWEQLKCDPDSLLPPFIEEVLRLEASLQGVLRMTTTEVELHGTVIPARAPVVLRIGAANRDERRYHDPDEICLTRRQPRSHLGFGTGAHHCVGAPLARSELFHGFRALLDRVQTLALAAGAEPQYKPSYFIRSLSSLKIEVTPEP